MLEGGCNKGETENGMVKKNGEILKALSMGVRKPNATSSQSCCNKINLFHGTYPGRKNVKLFSVVNYLWQDFSGPSGALNELSPTKLNH